MQNPAASPPAPAPAPDQAPAALATASLPGPERLLGLEAGAVTALLGEPVFARNDPPALLWRYRDDGCVLDLFLYVPSEGGSPRVDHVETRGHTVAEVDARACFHRLVAATAQGQTAGN